MTPRTYCYVRYCQREDAEQAIKKLHNYEIRPGFFLAVTKSVDNRKLVIKPSPALAVGVTEEETREEISKILDGVVRVRFISSRWLELEFHSHRMAAVARRILVPGNLTMFQSIGIKQVGLSNSAGRMLNPYMARSFFQCFYSKGYWSVAGF